MSGNNFMVDTNIILYILNGNKESFITELELLGFKGIKENEKEIIKDFLLNVK